MALTDETFRSQMQGVTAVVSTAQEELTFLALVQNIPIYDGNSPGELETFLVAIRSALPLKDNRDKYCIRAASMRSSKLVRQVVETFIMSSASQTWDSLEKELRKYFGQTADPVVLRSQLSAIKQSKDETIHHYHKRLEIAAKKAYPSPLSTSDTLVQEALVRTFVQGLKDKRIKRRLIILNPATMTDALEKASKEEETQQRFSAFGESPSMDDRNIEPMDCSMVQESTVDQVQSTVEQVQYVNESYPQNTYYVPQEHVYFQQQVAPSSDVYYQHQAPSSDVYYQQQEPDIYQQEDSMNEYHDTHHDTEDNNMNPQQEDQPEVQVYAISSNQVKRCWTCGSTYHLNKYCPQNRTRLMTQPMHPIRPLMQKPSYQTYQGWQVSLPPLPQKRFQRFQTFNPRPQGVAYRPQTWRPQPAFVPRPQAAAPRPQHPGQVGAKQWQQPQMPPRFSKN